MRQKTQKKAENMWFAAYSPTGLHSEASDFILAYLNPHLYSGKEYKRTVCAPDYCFALGLYDRNQDGLGAGGFFYVKVGGKFKKVRIHY